MKTAFILQVVVLAYHQVTTLFDFYPFNGARFSKPKERLLEAAFNGVLMAAAPAGYLLHWPGALSFGAGFYVILFAAELTTWFVPYFFGASEKWQEIYSRVQGRTFSIMPRRGNNPAPNVEHMILMGLTLATAMATLSAFRSVPNHSFGQWWIAAIIGGIVIGGIVSSHCCLKSVDRVEKA